MTPKQLAEEGLRERLLEAVLAHTGVQPGWPHYDAGRVVVLVLDAIEPAIEAEFKARAEEFRRLARGSCSQSNIARVMGATFSATLEEGKAEAYHKAAQMLEERLNG